MWWIGANSSYEPRMIQLILNTHLHYCTLQGVYSLSGKTSYRKISWSLEAARFGFKLFQSLWNLAGTSAALLPRCLSNFRAIRPLQHPISRLRDFARFGGKTSYRLVNRGPEVQAPNQRLWPRFLRNIFYKQPTPFCCNISRPRRTQPWFCIRHVQINFLYEYCCILI